MGLPVHDNIGLESIRHYLRRGWFVVPLHDVANGTCSCGNPGNDPNHDHTQGGKHPRARGWQEHENLIKNESDALAYWTATPNANIGLATGHTYWVLDEDTYNGADLNALIAGREWPTTYTVRTGGGGRQFYFTLPDFTVTAGMAKRLPAGFDIRGKGGQVVAPPSVSGKGAYSVLVDPGMMAPGPAWLLDMMREPERSGWNDSHGLSSALTDSQAVGSSRAQAYVKAALSRECATFATLIDGRQQEAFPFACRLIELANLAGMPIVAARDLYVQVCESAASNGPTGLTLSESLRVWNNAVRHVGDRCAEMGPPPEMFPGVPTRPFGSAVNGDGGRTDSHGLSSGLTDSQMPGQSADDDWSTWIAPEPVDPYEAAVQAEAWKIKVRTEARRRIDEEAGVGLLDRVAALKAQLLTRQGLRDIPALVPLIHGVLYRDTFVRLVGASGHGKSFVALGQAASVATGTPWAGHAVPERGRVLYIVAEGAAGMDKRVSAIEREIGADLDGITFLPMPVRAPSPEWDALIELCRQEKPDLIIGDTQARLTVGVDENSATEMGEVVDACERLRRATGACVMLVHHTGLNGEHGRGSTAVKAALQTELVCTRRGDQVTISAAKQKDDASDVAYVFTMARVVVGTDAFGDVVSMVLRHVPGAVVTPPDVMISDGELTGATGKLALMIGEVFATGNGGTKAEIYRVVRQRNLMAQATFFRAWNGCLEEKVIGRIRGSQSWRYVPPEDRVRVTERPPDDTKGWYFPSE